MPNTAPFSGGAKGQTHYSQFYTCKIHLNALGTEKLHVMSRTRNLAYLIIFTPPLALALFVHPHRIQVPGTTPREENQLMQEMLAHVLVSEFCALDQARKRRLNSSS